MLARRSFLTGLVSALTAPAIVRAASLMPVKALVIPPRFGEIYELLSQCNDLMEDELYMEANEKMAHKLVFNSIPVGSWRQYNREFPRANAVS